jgi:hypothetical protein
MKIDDQYNFVFAAVYGDDLDHADRVVKIDVTSSTIGSARVDANTFAERHLERGWTEIVFVGDTAVSEPF